MTWQHWIIAGLLVLSFLPQWAAIDKPRKPMSTEFVAGSGLLKVIVLMLLFWGQA